MRKDVREGNVGDIRLDTWDAFLGEVDSLYKRLPAHDPTSAMYVSDLLFRGQADASWQLDTTLERWAGPDVLLASYYNDVRSGQHEIESRTGRSWEIPDYPDYVELLKSSSSSYPRPNEMYEYFVYLRHHGFPSPLLDWTASPFIAAYFAFRSAEPGGDVAIYCFREHAGKGKRGVVGAPEVRGLGPFVRTHQRHYLQQSQYTVCLADTGLGRKYVSHELVLSESNSKQDLLWKFVLPGALRETALTYLYRHNITAFSLLGSEEALMESLAVRQYVLRGAGPAKPL